jgi:hypothetical protein
MKVIKVSGDGDSWSDDTPTVTFDSGLVLTSEFQPDCCTYNYLDFEQLHEGREFPTMSGTEFLAAIVIKEDGFIIKDSFNVPAWVQARSRQNGYYSSGVDLVVYDNGVRVTPVRERYNYDQMFAGIM